MTNLNRILKSRDITLLTKIWRVKAMVFPVVMPNILLEKSGKIAPERMKRLGQSGNDAHLWMCLVVKEKSDTLKNNIA